MMNIITTIMNDDDLRTVFIGYAVFWLIGAVLVAIDIWHSKRHPPKPQDERYTKFLEQ